MRTGAASFVMLFTRINDDKVMHKGNSAPGERRDVRWSLMAGSCFLAREEHSQRSSGAEFCCFKMNKIVADAFKIKRLVRAERITCVWNATNI